MSGFPASLGRLLGAGLFAAVSLLAAWVPAEVWAQGGPTQLIPGVSPSDSSQSQPADTQPADTRPLDQRRPANVPEGVQIERLGAVDPAGLGLLREADGGLPRSLWQGTDRGQVERLIAAIKPTRSAAALTLTRRLLLSEADPPSGTAGQPGLFALRRARLVAIGDPDSAFQLARLAPGDSVDMQAVEAGLLADRAPEACALLPSIPEAVRDAEWRRTGAFCRVVAKDMAGANIQTGLLRERGEADPVFLTLMTALAGFGDGKPIALEAPTPLQIAMLKAAGKPPATVDGLPPAAARLVADMAAAPADTRLRAAERAFVYGAMPVEGLRTAYGRDALPPKDVAAALAGKPAEDARARAALFQAVQQAEGGVERAAALAAALDRLRGPEGGLDVRLAMAFLDRLLEIRPAPERVPLALNAARLLLVAGQEPAAAEWDQLLRWEGRGGNIDAARAAVKLYPLIAIGGSQTIVRDDLLDWIDAWRAGPKLDGFESRAVVVLSALQGLGQPVPGEVWGRLAGSPAPALGHRPNLATLRAMHAAADANRLGETIMLALLALDGESPAALEAQALATVLDSLVKVGLAREARLLALEAAIGLGL
jgi:hypothetical protein